MNIEAARLDAADRRERDWKLWGPYISERAWGTVREDYSADGSAWNYFPFEHSHLRAYRWNEDGIGGICDRSQHICFSLSLWNEQDNILKERLFGLTGPQGNHGEDVKEYYYYLDATPTNSYLKYLYKYPQNEFPYDDLLKTNERLTTKDEEYELIDTGIFDNDEYFDVTIEYAKASPRDICIKISVDNRGENRAPLHILPTLWFRNRWSWDSDSKKPEIKLNPSEIDGLSSVSLSDDKRGNYSLVFGSSGEFVFTENESNVEKLYGQENSGLTKDGIAEYLINGDENAISRESGSKGAAHFSYVIPGNEKQVIYLRLLHEDAKRNQAYVNEKQFEIACEAVLWSRKHEADEFYDDIVSESIEEDSKMIMRQSLAGMIWTKQYYNYVVRDWLNGDPASAPPPEQRKNGRNSEWQNVYAEDVISMPDKWEYPWFAAWDLAFHCVPLALIDPHFAKRQLLLLLREWYMSPSGQIPAYEWEFGDVNPPVHAWAALEIYKIEKRKKGKGDLEFLERIFHKLLLNFTWWVNRKDIEGDNLFEGGFLGLDNIGIFDRSKPLPTGGHMEQSDGSSWMAMFCLNMLSISFELAQDDIVYQDVASKFFEHFVYISDAMNKVGPHNSELWNEQDGFYYDVLQVAKDDHIPMRIRSMVGLIPLCAISTIPNDLMRSLPAFHRRTNWFLKHRPDLTSEICCMQQGEYSDERLISLVNPDRLRKILEYMLAENEFLSDYGIRALSRFHKDNPFYLSAGGTEYRVGYEPGESESNLFGGNSNWRGPIWFPVNFLIIEALRKFDSFYKDQFTIEFPTGSGDVMNLGEVAEQLEQRLIRIFRKDANGKRAVFGNVDKFQNDPHFNDNIFFSEYFHGDNGRGLGASHQTGWTGLIAQMIIQGNRDYHSEEDR